MGLDDVFDDRKTEARAAEFAAAGLIDAVKPLERRGADVPAEFPAPSSATAVSIMPSFSAARIVTWPPAWVYLIALSSRLKRT